MPSVPVKLYSIFFKIFLRHRLQSLLAAATEQPPTPRACNAEFGVSCRPDESTAPANPSFSGADGVASKDLHLDPTSALSVRIFLPDPSPAGRRLSLVPPPPPPPAARQRRLSDSDVGTPKAAYRGYLPTVNGTRQRPGSAATVPRMPVIVQFHGGSFVSGSNTSVANDTFCRRVAKLCDAIVVAVGYRLAPESQYPAAFEDGVKVLRWLGKQANLAVLGSRKAVEGSAVDTFSASTAEPWLAAHGDPSRCVLLGVSCGANIANYVARKAVESSNLFQPVKVVAQVLMHPFFIGSVPTHSELRLVNSYFYDKSMCTLAWKLFLPESEFSLDHPAANPLMPNRGGPPLKCMPPTLTIVAEHDCMRDRAIAYSEELRKVNVDAPVLDYKDAVHEFATLDMLLKTPQAQACAEDISIWMKKYISLRGHEFSY